MNKSEALNEIFNNDTMGLLTLTEQDIVMGAESDKRIAAVPDAKKYGVVFAAYRNGQFQTVSEYDLPNYLVQQLIAVSV